MRCGKNIAVACWASEPLLNRDPTNRRYLGLVIYDWGGKVRKSGQVGGRAHASKRYSTHSFVWDGGSNGHPNGRGDAFLVLSGRYDGRDQIKKHNNNTSGVAQQNASRIWPETRSIGRSTTFDR